MKCSDFGKSVPKKGTKQGNGTSRARKGIGTMFRSEFPFRSAPCVFRFEFPA